LWVIFVQSTLERWAGKVCKINTGSREILVIFSLPFVLDVYATFPYDKRVKNLILFNEVIPLVLGQWKNQIIFVQIIIKPSFYGKFF